MTATTTASAEQQKKFAALCRQVIGAWLQRARAARADERNLGG